MRGRLAALLADPVTLSHMSFAVVWGWYGVGGAVAMFVLGMFALFAMFANLDDASAGQPVLRQLMGNGRGALVMVRRWARDGVHDRQGTGRSALGQAPS